MAPVAGHLHVHDCMGCALQVEGKAWGVLTLDSLRPGSFNDTDIVDSKWLPRKAAEAQAGQGC